MGVRGLKSLIENNDKLLVKDFHLHDTLVIVDACNIISCLIKQSQEHERRDLFGGDMVQYGRSVTKFFTNLQRCKIQALLVFDGAQTNDKSKSKTVEKQRRAIEKFQTVMSINRFGFGDFILPATASNVFRSIAVDMGLKLVQCMYEADSEIARLAHLHHCSVISNDSDFYLMDLPDGLISVDLFDHQRVRKSDDAYSYLSCSIFNQKNFQGFLPDLDPKNLPLLGILAGNDFIKSNVFESICGLLSSRKINLDQQSSSKLKKNGNKQHMKLTKILYFLCDKTLNEAINQVCNHVPKDKRTKLKNLIQSNLKVYHIPSEDDFHSELSKLYWPGFKSSYFQTCDEQNLKLMFSLSIQSLQEWLKRAMEQSVLSYRCLELAHRNVIFIQSHMDDPELPSAHLSQVRCMRVMMTLLRSSRQDSKPCIMYDRMGVSYGKTLLKPMVERESFQSLNHIAFELPNLSLNERKAILAETFHFTDATFLRHMMIHNDWLGPEHKAEFVIVKLLFDYIDRESNGVKLWKHFRQATLLCILYHLLSRSRIERTLVMKLEDEDNIEFIDMFLAVVSKYKYNQVPNLSKRRRLYNCRVMHQITQLQSSIVAFNWLNAFLGDVFVRIRSEYWLNSCLIYNLAENLHNKTLKIPNMPEVVHLKA